MAGDLVLKVATHSVSDLKNGVVFSVGSFVEATPEFFLRYPGEFKKFDQREYPGVDLRKVSKVRFGGTLLNGPAVAKPVETPIEKKEEAKVAAATAENAEAGDEAAAEKEKPESKKMPGMSTADLKGKK